MDYISYMSDYLAVRLLALAQVAERRFEACLLSCPESDGVIRVLEPEAFTILLENRITSLLFSMTSLSAYLSYYAAETARKLGDAEAGTSLKDFLERHGLLSKLKDFPNRLKRRHELIIEENGERPLSLFLGLTSLTLEEKVIYFPLIRTRKLVSWKDGYMKKLSRLMALAAELRSPGLELSPEIKTIGSTEELQTVFLHHDLPPELTLGQSAADRCAVEAYAEGHFFWELLHCYPARAVPEVIQYLHRMDQSDHHFITVTRAFEVDESGAPVSGNRRKIVIEIGIEK